MLQPILSISGMAKEFKTEKKVQAKHSCLLVTETNTKSYIIIVIKKTSSGQRDSMLQPAAKIPLIK